MAVRCGSGQVRPLAGPGGPQRACACRGIATVDSTTASRGPIHMPSTDRPVVGGAVGGGAVVAAGKIAEDHGLETHLRQRVKDQLGIIIIISADVLQCEWTRCPLFWG